MSEAVSTGAAAPSAGAATQSAGTSGQSAVSQNQGASPGQAGQAEGQGNQAQAQAGTQERFLAEQDYDAFVEHTINGKKEKIKLRDALNGYGLDKTAQQKMQEAAAIRKQTQQLMHLMETDPKKFCEVTGKDYDQWMRTHFSSRKDLAEEILAKEYELQQMDPHQRKAMELEQQLQEIQGRELKSKQPLIDKIKELLPPDRLPKGLEKASVEELNHFYQARQAEFNQGVDSIQNEMLEAWQKTGMPRQKDIGSWMAQVMMDHEKKSAAHRKQTGQELPPLQAEQAAAKVKARLFSMNHALCDQMTGEQIIKSVIGEQAAEKVREYFVNLASQSGPKFDPQGTRPANGAASEPKRYMNQTEWRKAHGLA